MNLQDEIVKLWSEKSGKLDEIYDRAFELLKMAMQSEDVPYDILVDVIVSANTSLGYGSTISDAEFIFKAFSKLIKSENPGKIPKVRRFACLMLGSLLTLITVDEASTKKELNAILGYLNIPSESSRINTLRSIHNQMGPLLDDFVVNYWSLEFISFLLILYCIIETIDNIQVEEREILERIMKLKGIITDPKEKPTVLQWKERWIEINDYFRFNTMMIFGNTPKSENLLLDRFKAILS